MPVAGGDRTVDEDVAYWFNGTDSTGTAVTMGWVIDGSTINGADVQFTFATPGTYSAAFWADDGTANVSDTITVTVLDLTAPSGSGTVPSTANEDASVAFSSAGVTDNDPNFVSDRRDYWTFTDGTAQNLSGSSQSYTFATPGTYAITLTVMDAAGNTFTSSFSIVIADITNPAANAGADQTVDEDTVVSFDASATADNDPNFGSNGRYYWTFNDGGTARSFTGKTFTYTFATPGSVTVTLLVLDAAGNFGSDTMVVTARDVTAPTGSGSVPSSSNEDALVTFASGAITDNDPAFASTRRDYWTFTDGSARNLSGTSPSHTFATPGTFSVTLTVMDAAGNMLTSAFSIAVVDITAPTGSGTVPLTANEDASVSFSSSSITDNDPTFASNRRDYWTFTDGSAQNLSGSSASYTFATPGSYAITLTVMDNTGNQLTASFTISIRDITMPTGSGSVPTNANEDTLVSFSSSSIADNDPNFVSGRRDYWTFTDGSARNLSGSSASYTFATPGSFAITLTVMDAAGNKLTGSFTIVIADVTAPTVTIGASSVAQSRERFSSFTHTGSVTDNVAVSAYWWMFTDVTDQNVSGASMTRQWPNTGSYTLTLFARDAAFNIGSASTTFTVTADVTLPTITWTQAPIVGNDQTALTYAATATDNDPSCSTACNWTWSRDAVAFAWGVTSVTVTWTPGLHTLSLSVRDATGNTRVGTQNVNVDQLVQSDLTWDGVTQPLNWNVRVTNGATFLIRNSTISNSNVGITANINVTDGRFIMENSQLISSSPTVGFRINATRATPTASVVLFFNGSTVSGLYDWIWVVNGTLAATGSTFTDARAVNGGLMSGVNSNFYLTNVIMNATAVPTASGMRANFTATVNATTTKEVLLEGVSITTVTRPFQMDARGVAGSVVTRLRDTVLRSTTTVATVRGVDIFVGFSTGTFTFTFERLDAQDIRPGAVYAVHQTFNGTVRYIVTDSDFSGSTSGNGTTYQFVDSTSVFDVSYSGVVITRSGLAGTAFRFVNNSLPIPSFNRGSIQLTGYSAFNNTQDGLYFYQYFSRLDATIAIQSSSLTLNKRAGMYIDTNNGNVTHLAWSLTDSDVSFNSQRGIFYNSFQQRVNHSFVFLRSTVENNTLDGFNLTHIQGSTFDPTTYGNFWINITSSKLNSNSRTGLGLYERNSAAQWGVSINLVDSQLNFNGGDGLNIYQYMRQYYTFRGQVVGPQSSVWVDMVRSEISRNNQHGVNLYTYYCGYGATTGAFPASCLFQFNLTESHIDWNDGRGMFIYLYYSGYYGSAPLNVNVLTGSTVDWNGAAGIYEYRYYNYMRLVGSGRTSDSLFYIRNASLSYNGRVTSAEGFGLDTYYHYDYYLFGSRMVDADNATFQGNVQSGVRWNPYYAYYPGAVYQVEIANSTFVDNGAYGYDSAYYTQYQIGGIYETLRNNTFRGNVLGAIRAGIPQSYGRYFVPYDIRYLNNTIDGSPSGISSYVSYSYPTYYYAGSTRLNISGNRITNITGSAIGWAMDPPASGYSNTVDMSDNWIENTGDVTSISMPGSTGTSHFWTVSGNTFINTSTSALTLSLQNIGAGNLGSLTFERNSFRDTQGVAFSLLQSNILMNNLMIRDCVFINQQTAIQLTGITGTVDNATFAGSIKEDIWLANGVLDVHNTAVDVDKLVPIGSAAFNVYFHLKLYVSWAGSGRPATGAIVEVADALGSTFFVGSVPGAAGLPSFELLSYTKSVQGKLGRSPFRVQVNYFELSQVDSIDLPSDRTVSVLLRDSVPPSMVIASPVEGTATRLPTLQVEGYAYDSQSGFTSDPNDPTVAAQFIEVSADGVTWQNPQVIDGSVSELHFQMTLTDLEQGIDRIFVRIHDEAGNTVTREIPVVLDWSAPEITLLTPVPPITRASTVRIEGETEVGASVYINGVVPLDIVITPDGKHLRFTMDVKVQEGPNTIAVLAVDALRNQGHLTIFVLADREAPYLVVLTPEDDALTNADSMTVKGRATDRNGVSVTVNGRDAPLDALGNFSVVVPLVGATTHILVLATDSPGNTQLITRNVKFDNTPPWITVDTPVADALLNTAEVAITGNVEQGSTLMIDGEPVDTPRGIFVRRILLAEGPNTIHLEATDPAGNKLVVDQHVVVDTRKPVIVLNLAGDQVLWNKSSIKVDGRVTDEHAVTLSIEGVGADLAPDGNFTTTVALLEGTNSIELRATDAAGNVQVRQLIVVRDTTAPVVAPTLEGLVSDGGRYTTRSTTVAVTGVAESGSIVEVCYASAAGPEQCNVAAVSPDGSFRTYVEVPPNQVSTIRVQASDEAGNSAARSFTIEQQQPVFVEPEQPWVAYGLLGLAAAVLAVGAVFMIASRRGRGRAVPSNELGGDVASASPPLYEAPTLAVAPITHEEAVPTSAPPALEPAVTAPEPPENLAADMAAPLPAAVPEARKVRPMRRRPVSPSSEGAAGASGQGASAEGEAPPSDIPAEQNEEGSQ